MRVLASAVLVVGLAASPARGEPEQPDIVVGGYLEGYYAFQAEDASNRVIALRAFDNRSRTFALSTAALDLRGTKGPVTTHLVLQIGDTPTTYYAAEPAWRYLQAANVTANAPHGYVIEAGLFPSPIGPEVLPVKDNWNWSRSNLFYALPFYHLGAMVSHPIAGHWSAKLHVYNGWNDIADNNDTPSVAVSASYAAGATTAQVLYFGGNERPQRAPEGRAWRSLFDAQIQLPVSDVVTLQAHADAGFEPNALGTSTWAGVALYAKFQVTREVYVAIRGDVFHEKAAGAPIFFGIRWIGEGSATIAYQPVTRASLRLEYRHDQASRAAYFGGAVNQDPATGADIPDRDMQDTVTLGGTAWF